MRTLLLSLVLLGCGSVVNNTPDANSPDAPPADAASTVDADTTPRCADYCNTIMMNCTGTNAQYADMAHCTGSCTAFVVGTSQTTDMTGDTLGCRIYHAGAAGGSTANATLHCPHAGPGGDPINGTPMYCSGGDACTNFCALEIKTCGSTDAPATVAGTAITPQYQNMNACVTLCKNGNASAGIAPFDLTHPYATNAAGNSLACRLNHWTNAAAQAGTNNGAGTNVHCGHTGAAQTTGLPCNGVPTP